MSKEKENKKFEDLDISQEEFENNASDSKKSANENNPSDNENANNLEELISNLEEENKKLQDQLQSAVATARNSSNRLEKEKVELKKYGGRKLGEQLIPNIDLFKKVIASGMNNPSPEIQNYLKGFEMVSSRMDEALKNAGITQMQIEIGSEFDSKIENAFEEVEDENFKSNQVVEVVANGYMIHDQVLIHAQVKVAK